MRRRAMRSLKAWALSGASLAFLFLFYCKGQVPLTAPMNAELTISANPTAIPVVNGVSTITVLGFKSAEDGGGPLTDGTQIFFTTNVGVIEERVEMQNGVARGFLRSNGRAGLATVEARSGAGVTAMLEPPVLIGNAQGINILVTANPPSLQPPDFTTLILATVFDNDNNPMRDIPLIFSTSGGALASMGSILRTNALGQAEDRLTLLNENQATVTVNSGSISGSVSVARATARNPIVTSVFPSSAAPGDTVSVTITGLNFQPGAVVSFGDGIGINSVTFVDSTTLVVNISIDSSARARERTVTVTNPDGLSGSLANGFAVGPPPPVISSISPASSGTRGTPITLTFTGTGFQSGATVSFDPGGIVVNSVTFVSSTQIQVSITVDNLETVVPQGTQFDVTVTNPDLGTATKVNGFTVTSMGS